MALPASPLDARPEDALAQRLGTTAGAPLARALLAIVPHVHEAIRETRPTRQQWRETLDFLTEVGQACDAHRQEWVLLSDVIGASALVEALNSARPTGATPNTPRGPFYRQDAPEREDGGDISLDGRGEPLAVTLSIVDLDGAPVAGAGVETWQPNGDGEFENQRPEAQPEWNLRATFTSGADGRVRYRTVRPAGTWLPDDGPVGQLLGSIGFPMARPAHLQYRVTATGFDTLVTHLYDGDDPLLDRDALQSVRPELVARLTSTGTGSWTLDHTFILARTP